MVSQPSQRAYWQVSPVKKVDGLGRIIWKLNTEYSFALAPPSQRAQFVSRNVNEAVSSQIRFLFYKHKEKLDSTLDEFSKRASVIRTEWVFKPRADSDTIPQRDRGLTHSGGEFVGEEISPEIVQQLVNLLQNLLNKAISEGL